MDCDSAREAISAVIDGEASGLPDAALETHLASCAPCRAWQQRAHAVTRRARLGGAFLDHDLAPRVLAAVPATEAWWRRRTARRGNARSAAADIAPAADRRATDRPVEGAPPASGGGGRDESVA